MEKFNLISKIEQIYSRGGNIIKYLKEVEHKFVASAEDIMISYDFQAGTYREAYEKNSEFHEIKEACNRYIANVINSFPCSIESVLEAGVGEAIALVPILTYLKHDEVKWIGGNDISYSRIKIAKEFARDHGVENINLFVADIFHMPISSDSIDVVYTCHALEPNGGFEHELLNELYRIARKYIVLVEPDFENANSEGKKYMEYHGYVKGLANIARSNGWNVIADEPVPIIANPKNPSRLIVIRKDYQTDGYAITNKFACPITHEELKMVGNAYYSSKGMLAYPIINDIPCLRKENAVLATKME